MIKLGPSANGEIPIKGIVSLLLNLFYLLFLEHDIPTVFVGFCQIPRDKYPWKKCLCVYFLFEIGVASLFTCYKKKKTHPIKYF